MVVAQADGAGVLADPYRKCLRLPEIWQRLPVLIRRAEGAVQHALRRFVRFHQTRRRQSHTAVAAARIGWPCGPKRPGTVPGPARHRRSSPIMPARFAKTWRPLAAEDPVLFPKFFLNPRLAVWVLPGTRCQVRVDFLPVGLAAP